MSDPNIKQITLVSKPQEGGKEKVSRRKTVKKMELPVTKEGGGSTSPGTITQMASSHVPTTPGSPEPVGVNSPLTQVGAPVQVAGKAASNPVKVVLAAAKKKKVVLAAAKPVVKPAAKTRKNTAARKVRMNMAGLSRKIHVAKTIRQKAVGDKIEDIKKALEKAALIKAGSKAPEQMLRQMYADYMMLKKRAL